MVDLGGVSKKGKKCEMKAGQESIKWSVALSLLNKFDSLDMSKLGE